MRDMYNLYLKMWRNYAVFTGRAPRKEMWAALLGNLCLFFAFYIVCFVVGAMAGIVDYVIASDSFSGLVIFFLGIADVLLHLALILPCLGILVRRLHDTGKSGWKILITIVPVVGILILLFDLYLLKGTNGPNLYGEDPLK